MWEFSHWPCSHTIDRQQIIIFSCFSYMRSAYMSPFHRTWSKYSEDLSYSAILLPSIPKSSESTLDGMMISIGNFLKATFSFLAQPIYSHSSFPSQPLSDLASPPTPQDLLFFLTVPIFFSSAVLPEEVYTFCLHKFITKSHLLTEFILLLC